MSSVVSQANMESKNHNQAETKTPDSESAPVSTSLCERKFDENSGVMTNIRIRMSDFIHAPMDERKACLKETYQKVYTIRNYY